MQFLLIAKPKEGVAWEQMLPHLEGEVRKSWQFVTQGTLRQQWLFAEGPGAVFIWEAESRETLDAMLAEYPMYKEGLLDFQVTSLKPYDAYSTLFK